jgi:hypothetical protein
MRLILLLASAATMFAADFYVAPNGNDSAKGSAAAPFATLDRARAAVRDLKQHNPARTTPIVVQIHGGNYYLKAPVNFTADDSGSERAPVVYQAAPGEKPVISGGRPITGWKSDSNNKAWTAVLPADTANFEQLFVNSERRYRPRTTKGHYLYMVGPVISPERSQYCRDAAQGGFFCYDRFQFKPGDLKETYHNMTDVEVNVFEVWTMAKLRLKSVDMQKHIAYLAGPTAMNRNSGFMPNHRYLVENVKESLSEPGEWYLDRAATPWTLTYIPKPGETIAKTTVVAPQIEQLIMAEGLQYCTFKGLAFVHANWVLPPEGHQSFQTESEINRQTGKPFVPAAVSFTKSSYVVLDGCVIAHVGGWGLEFVGRGPFQATPVNQVLNSAVYDLGVGGIRIGGRQQREDTEETVAQYNVVRNNVVRGGGRILPAGIGTAIWIGASHHNIVSHNDVSDFYCGGIGVLVPAGMISKMPHDNLIEFNDVYQIGQGVMSDFGGIYIVGFETTGNQVMNNKVHDIIHHPDLRANGADGIYIDNITSHVLVKNNLVYRVTHSTMFNNRGRDNTWTNNILAYGRNGMLQRGADEFDDLSFRFTNNIIYFARLLQKRLPDMDQFFGDGPPPLLPMFQLHPEMARGGRRAPQRGRVQEGGVHVEPVAGGTSPRVRGGELWSCMKNDGTPVPCTQRFLLDSNLYWSLNGKPLTFITTDDDNILKPTERTFDEWKALGEDVHSVNADPLFVDPSYPADDFRLRPGSPAEKIGFVPFDPNQAGRTSSELKAPPVPPAFPVIVLDPEKEFGQPRRKK